MGGGKIEFAELAFWKFKFYLGQQVALLSADKTTGSWKLNSWIFEVKINPQDFRKWIFTSVMSISIFNFHKNWLATIYTHPASTNTVVKHDTVRVSVSFRDYGEYLLVSLE